MKLVIHIDGGSRGNPGQAGAGVVMTNEQGDSILEKGYFLGHQTNNVAEYTALLRAIAAAQAAGAMELMIYCDSELLVRQMNGEYRVKNEALKDCFDQAMAGLKMFTRWKITHIRREGNVRADELANLAMDAGEDVEEINRIRSREQSGRTTD